MLCALHLCWESCSSWPHSPWTVVISMFSFSFRCCLVNAVWVECWLSMLHTKEYRHKWCYWIYIWFTPLRYLALFIYAWYVIFIVVLSNLFLFCFLSFLYFFLLKVLSIIWQLYICIQHYFSNITQTPYIIITWMDHCFTLSPQMVVYLKRIKWCCGNNNDM